MCDGGGRDSDDASCEIAVLRAFHFNDDDAVSTRVQPMERLSNKGYQVQQMSGVRRDKCELMCCEVR